MGKVSEQIEIKVLGLWIMLKCAFTWYSDMDIGQFMTLCNIFLKMLN